MVVVVVVVVVVVRIFMSGIKSFSPRRKTRDLGFKKRKKEQKCKKGKVL